MPISKREAECQPRGRRAWKLALLAACLALVAGLAIALLRAISKPAPTLSLKAAFVNGEVQVQWDPAAPPLRNAQHGLLEVVNGGVTIEIDLESGDLRKGNTSYRPKTGDLLVRFKVQPGSGKPVEEVLRVFGRPTPPRESPGDDLGLLRTEVQRQAAQSAELEAEINALEKRAESIATAPDRPRTPKPLKIAARPPATVQTPPAIPAAPPPPSAEQPRVELPRPVTQPPPPEPAPRETARPASGKLIWTGNLPKNGVLSIEGKRASTGSLNGELPKAPFRIGVYPAGLSVKGLTVYTANPKYREPAHASEPPGPQNGWNQTLYTWDPKRANDIVVTKAPGAQNGWTRLVLHGGPKAVTVIILEWELIP